jgi:hypothetical protein
MFLKNAKLMIEVKISKLEKILFPKNKIMNFILISQF